MMNKKSHWRINWKDLIEVSTQIIEKNYNGYCVIWLEGEIKSFEDLKKMRHLELTTA